MIKGLIILSFFLFTAKLNGQSIPAQIDSLMNYCHLEFQFDGVVLAAEKDEIIYEKAFGLANREWEIPNTVDTKFRLGSISKQFTAFLVMQLAYEKMLSLNDKISKYLEDISGEATIRNLLTHTSGIPDYTDMKEFDERDLYACDSLIKLIAGHKLNFQPGSKYEYSNSNFYLLGAIAEKVSGKNFNELLTEKILIPAGMKNSGNEKEGEVIYHHAESYMPGDNGFVKAGFIEIGNARGGGGMYSTVDDMLSWSRYFQKQLSENQFYREAIQPFRLADGTMSIYSCGWCLLPDMMVHGGHFPGFANYFSVDTAYRQTIVLLSNNWYPLLYVTTKTIHNILHHDSHAIDWIRNESSQDINDYTGTYSLDDISVEFKVEPTGLVSLFSGKKQFLKQFANDEFFLTDFGGNIRFNRDKNNKIISVSSFENYRWVELKKVN